MVESVGEHEDYDDVQLYRLQETAQYRFRELDCGVGMRVGTMKRHWMSLTHGNVTYADQYADDQRRDDRRVSGECLPHRHGGVTHYQHFDPTVEENLEDEDGRQHDLGRIDESHTSAGIERDSVER